MTDQPHDDPKDTALADVAETDPRSKKGKFGNAAHGGDQAGPNAADAGRTIAPQKGNPRQDDRARG